MNISKRKFIKTLGICGAIPLIPFAGFSEPLPKRYHKITKDWSISCGSVTNWNDFNCYSKVGLTANNDFCSRELDNNSEYILRSTDVPGIYVNKNKCYEISNYKGNFVGENDTNLFEVQFDINRYLGSTPNERIIIISGSDYCIYALGRDYYKEVEKDCPPFRVMKVWILDRHEVFHPLTEEMHSKIKYFDFNRKTYKEYLQLYDTKLKELGLI